MRTFFTILGIAGGVVLLVLVAVAIAVWTVDPNDFVGPIRKHVKEATGRDLAVGGGIRLELGLEPKVVLEDVRIGNAPWGKAPDLATAKRVEARLALLPLLERRFDLVQIDLDHPVIALETDGHGRGNWEFGPAAGEVAGAKDAAAPGSFFVGNLTVENGTLTYRDGATGSLTRVDIDALALNARDPSAPVNAEFRGRIDGIAVALTGSLGPLATLTQRGLPFPIAVQGEVAGRKSSLATQVRRADGVVELRDLDVSSGQSKVQGQMDIREEGGRSRLAVRLSSPLLSIDDVPLPPAPGAAPEAAADERKSARRYVFNDVAVPLAGLRAQDIEGELSIGRLVWGAGQHVDDVRVRFALADGRLAVTSFESALFGGKATGTLSVDATREHDAAIRLDVEGSELELAALLAAAGAPGDVRGGKTRVRIDVTTRGESPREWASAMSGSISAVVGPATLVNTRLDASLPLERLMDAVNPYRKVDSATELRCVVVRLPIQRGVARVDRSVALETRKIGAAASGTLDFRTETIDLAIKPQLNEGIPLDIEQFADLVRVRGTFVAPEVGVDAMASAAAAARAGSTLGKSGWSAVGKALLAGGAARGAGPCAVALGHASAPPSAPAGAPAPGSVPADDIGKALGRLLGR